MGERHNTKLKVGEKDNEARVWDVKNGTEILRLWCGEWKKRGGGLRYDLALSLCRLSKLSPYLGRCSIPDKCSTVSPRSVSEMMLMQPLSL